LLNSLTGVKGPSGCAIRQNSKSDLVQGPVVLKLEEGPIASLALGHLQRRRSSRQVAIMMTIQVIVRQRQVICQHLAVLRSMQNPVASPLLLISQQPPTKFLRLYNTHLKSLYTNPPIRPRQIKSTAKYLHDLSLYSSLLAGDLNAIEPFDTVLPLTYSLSDAYLALRDKGIEKGFTWAYQSLA